MREFLQALHDFPWTSILLGLFIIAVIEAATGFAKTFRRK